MSDINPHDYALITFTFYKNKVKIKGKEYVYDSVKIIFRYNFRKFGEINTDRLKGIEKIKRDVKKRIPEGAIFSDGIYVPYYRAEELIKIVCKHYYKSRMCKNRFKMLDEYYDYLHKVKFANGELNEKVYSMVSDAR